MAVQSLFISDLHLSTERPEILQAFLTFLSATAKPSNALYILGDLFDTWVGDDDDTAAYLEAAQALKTLSNRGCQVFFMHGNRDFLLGQAFAARCGMTLLQDPTIIQLPQGPALLQHGDTLCTDDLDYQAFRSMVRHPDWQHNILQSPLAARKALAQRLRASSQSMSSLKADDIMDVNTDEVLRVMAHHQVQWLIHGHTHRPARHQITVSNKAAERIVLGDWHDRGWYLSVSDKEMLLKDFAI